MSLNTTRRVGLIVNPIAGMGGSVGLKGTDGDLVLRARDLGARPQAPVRALSALQALGTCALPMLVLTCEGAMGESVARAAGLDVEVVYGCRGDAPTGADTHAAAGEMLARDIDLLLFVGGDGTARVLLDAVGDRVAVLGVPAGVKMHSGVFAVTPKTAGDVARRFLESAGGEPMLRRAEVMDRDPGDGDAASPRLYGYMRVPHAPQLVQAAKAGSPVAEEASLSGACRQAAARVADVELAIVGPGSTMLQLKSLLGGGGTLLGVDVYSRGRCIVADAGERALLELLDGRSARIVVTVIGGQGFVFGRGNQQLSPEVLRRVGPDNVIVVASPAKLVNLPGGVLRVDTGAADTDAAFAGHRPILTGRNRTMICRVVDVAAVQEQQSPGATSGVTAGSGDSL